MSITGRVGKPTAARAKRITGIDIQRLTDIAGCEVSDDNKAREAKREARENAPAVIVAIEYPTFLFLVKTTKKVVWDASDGNRISPTHGGHVIGVWLSDNPMFKSWSFSRSLNRGYKYATYEWERVIKPVLDKGIKVNDLRSVCFWGEYDFLGVR